MLDDRIGPYKDGPSWNFTDSVAMGHDGDAVRKRLRKLASEHTVFMAWTIGFLDITTGIHAAMAAWIQRPTLFKLGLVPRDFLKALALNTVIPTPSGLQTIEDIHTGDLVYGMSGHPVQVIGESPVRWHDDAWRIVFSTGEEVIADGGHLWETSARRDRDNHKGTPQLSIKTTRDIAESVWCRSERNHRVRVAYPLSGTTQEFLIAPYVLGAWLGDGTSTYAALSCWDEEIVAEIAKEGEDIRRSPYDEHLFLFNGGPGTPAYWSQEKSFSARLRKLGVKGNKHVPESYLLASLPQRLALLQGLMDTDGTMSRTGTALFQNTNRDLVESVRWLVNSLGMKASPIYEWDGVLRGKICGRVYCTSFYPDPELPPFRLARKLMRVTPRKAGNHRGYRQIVAVERADPQYMKCLMVGAPDGLFLITNSCIPTHNTSLWTVADTVRLISTNPEERILIRNEIHENARKFLYRIRRVPEACMLWQWLFPERMPNFDDGWHQDGLLFPRLGDYPELSIEVIGVGGASTSRHYTRIKDDDLIGKEAARSKATMQMAKDDHALATHLLVDPATSHLDTYGTRWAPRDLYVDMMRDEDDLDIFHCGPTDAQGLPLFPSRFPLEALERIRQRIGNRRYSLQMLNESPPEGAAELSLGDLNYYSRSTDQYGRKFFVLHHPEGEEEMVWLRDLFIFQTLDPNVSPDSKSSRSASVVVGLAKPRTKFAHFSILLLSATAKATTPKGAIELAHSEYEFWQPLLFGVEIVAAQVALKEWMLSTYPEMFIKGLKPDHGSAKLARIRSFTPYGENGHIYIHPSLKDFQQEWEEFPTGFMDLLDALSYMPYIWTIPSFDTPSPATWDRTRALTGLTDEIIEDEDRSHAYDGRNPLTGY